MQMIQTVAKISTSKLKSFSPILAVNFSTNKDSQTPNPFPQNPLDLPLKQPVYEHKTNYNFEQFKKYTKDRKEALELKQREEDIELKKKSKAIMPRRQRRLYATPKHDTNLEKYAAWRVFDRNLEKNHPRCLPVVCKIPLPPKYVRKVLGEGTAPFRNNRATIEYDFEDNNFDLFILYDYAATTQYWGANKSDFDYENQENVHPRKRIKKWPTPEEFWQSEEDHLFRVNCTDYADFRKFKKWLSTKINQEKDKESFDEIIKKKFGEYETFDNYDKKYEIKSDPAVFKYNMNYFMEPGEKFIKKTRFHDKVEPAKKLDDKHKIIYNVEKA